MEELPLSNAEFDGIRERIYRLAGISLGEAKRSMVVARLQRLLRQLKVRTFVEYFEVIDHSANSRDVQDFVNALTTNLTRFWREDHHFDHLIGYVGELIDERPRRSPDGRPRLRIWSAGCSTGQEAYCIAMDLLAAYPELQRWDFRILATDVDTSVLTKAAAGVYPESELTGVPEGRIGLLERTGKTVTVPEVARKIVSFKPLNLIAEWPMRGPFDAVFCRNVTIYFDKRTQSHVFSRLGAILAPGGYLYIGHSENLGSGNEAFRLVGKTVYQVTAKAAEARNAA